jgi:hypothetical protein
MLRCGDATVRVSTLHPSPAHLGSGGIPSRFRPPTLFGKRIGQGCLSAYSFRVRLFGRSPPRSTNPFRSHWLNIPQEEVGRLC